MKRRVLESSKRVEDNPCSCQKFYKRSKLHNCNTYVECLGQYYDGSFVVHSVFEKLYEQRLVDCVSFSVVSLSPLSPTLIYHSPLQVYQTQPNVLLQVCICHHQLLYDDSPMRIGSGTNPVTGERKLWLLIHYFQKSKRESSPQTTGGFLVPGFCRSPKSPLLSPLRTLPFPDPPQSDRSCSHPHMPCLLMKSHLFPLFKEIWVSTHQLCLLPSLFPYLDCSTIMCYFTTNIHLSMSTYHIYSSGSGIPHSGRHPFVFNFFDLLVFIN